MALSTIAREWYSKNVLEGFLRITDAPLHEEPEKVAPTIDLEEITEGTIQARGLRSIEKPSIEILTEYFGEYSLGSKAYRTEGGEDPLFREVVRILLEYVFVHSRPPVIPKYRAGFVIAVYECLKVDWTAIIADCLRSVIASLVDGKQAWTELAQWLTLLVPPVLAIKPKKGGRPETTPKRTSKRKQLLTKHTPGWTPGDSS